MYCRPYKIRVPIRGILLMAAPVSAHRKMALRSA